MRIHPMTYVCKSNWQKKAAVIYYVHIPISPLMASPDQIEHIKKQASRSLFFVSTGVQIIFYETLPDRQAHRSSHKDSGSDRLIQNQISRQRHAALFQLYH